MNTQINPHLIGLTQITISMTEGFFADFFAIRGLKVDGLGGGWTNNLGSQSGTFDLSPTTGNDVCLMVTAGHF